VTDNSDSVFGEAAITAVVAGGGAVGNAMVARVLAAHPDNRVFLLARREQAPLGDRMQVVSMDAEQPDTIARAAAEVLAETDRVHLLFNSIGLLHDGDMQPEKRVRDLRPDCFQRAMAVNALCLPLLATAFARVLKHDQPAMVASLSARVGSIEDNGAGGWYSYRASKAAHNQLLRTLSREWRVSHRNTTVVALHPGTVTSRLSQPFVGPSYPHRLLSPEECAEHLYDVMAGLTPAQTGLFFDWRGEPIPW
jgi:NAD(P)-dependent dehydrogenase (short-subunit alcohol dehydrogenase family)